MRLPIVTLILTLWVATAAQASLLWRKPQDCGGVELFNDFMSLDMILYLYNPHTQLLKFAIRESINRDALNALSAHEELYHEKLPDSQKYNLNIAVRASCKQLYMKSVPLCSLLVNPNNPTRPYTCPINTSTIAFAKEFNVSDLRPLQSLTFTFDTHLYDSSIGCVVMNIMPNAGPLENAGIIVAVMAFSIIFLLGTVLCLVINPWSGTSDPFKAFSNYGMDPDTLRLVCPGFTDLMFFWQYIALIACLSVRYPLSYILIMSKLAFALLLHPLPLLRHIYGTGDDLSELSTFEFEVPFDTGGATQSFLTLHSIPIAEYVSSQEMLPTEIWPSFMGWALFICTLVLLLCGIFLFVRFIFTKVSKQQNQYPGKISLYFLIGMFLRIWYMFLLPLTTFTSTHLSLHQTLDAPNIFFSALTFAVLVVLLPAWLIWYILRMKPRAVLFDDISVMNWIGPIYNTYSEQGLFMVVFRLCAIIARGIIIAILYFSGLLQVLLLATIEAIELYLLWRYRPHPEQSGQNLWGGAMAAFRMLLLILVCFCEIPSRSSSMYSDWLGIGISMTILIVLLVAFLVPLLQRLAEVLYFMIGKKTSEEYIRDREAGHQPYVFGTLQLSWRQRRGSMTNASVQQKSSESEKIDQEEKFYRQPKHLSKFDYEFTSEKLFSRTESFAFSLVDGSGAPSMMTIEPPRDISFQDFTTREADMYYTANHNQNDFTSENWQLRPKSSEGRSVFAKAPLVRKIKEFFKPMNPEEGKFEVVRGLPNRYMLQPPGIPRETLRTEYYSPNRNEPSSVRGKEEPLSAMDMDKASRATDSSGKQPEDTDDKMCTSKLSTGRPSTSASARSSDEPSASTRTNEGC